MTNINQISQSNSTVIRRNIDNNININKKQKNKRRKRKKGNI